MELYSPEVESLKKLVQAWIESENQELEATFGVGGQVDVTTFLNVAKRLRARGYTALPQQDRMTVALPNHVRFTLTNLGMIQQYCEDDIMAGKPFKAIVKDRTVAEANLDLDDYDMRLKMRREENMANDDPRILKLFTTWAQEQKAFRVIRRWTFEGEGMLIELSIVRSTARNMDGNYKWQKKFRDQDVMASPPIYEIEVELKKVEGDTVETAMKRLVRGIGEVLRGIQKHTFLLRKSVRDRVLRGYKELVKTDRFRGVAPITLEMPNFLKEREENTPNIRDGYNVTDKADGLRVMGFVDGDGELFMIDMSLNVYKTGLKNQKARKSLVDGEWVTQTKDNKPTQQFLIFDIYHDIDGVDCTKEPFYTEDKKPETRHERMKKWATVFNDGTEVGKAITAATRLQIAIKNFYFAKPNDNSIFLAASQVLTNHTIYNTDGLIFTPNANPIPDKPGVGFLEQFKWKPAHDNTIDFLVTFEKFTDSREERVTVAVKPNTGETVTYKTLRLFVGSSTDPAYDNPRQTILEGAALPSGRMRGRQEYRPVPFNPKEFPDTMANLCYLPLLVDESTGGDYVLTTKTMEPIQDKSIVEMAYEPSEPPGWRWKPLRVRMDKTERLQRGILGRTLNSDKVAEGVWNSIHDPITESMIRTGAEQPSESEMSTLSKEMESRESVARRYYERKAPEQDLLLVRGLRDFHNKYIKEQILYKAGLSGEGKTLIDLAVGKAADLQKWRRAGAKFVLGVDYAGDNITDPNNGAYRRYLDTIVKAAGRQDIPPMIFAIGDSSKNLVDGTAGATEQEKDILRSVLGRMRPVAAVPPYVEKYGASRLKLGADCISVMFALHYFFQAKETFDGFLKNLSDNLKVGGYFIGCCFDGERVFELLRSVEKGTSKSGMDGTSLLWSITKQYGEDSLPEDDSAFGMGIDVEFISIGTAHREYLVPFKLLQAKMESIGCELMTPEETTKIGLQNSTNLFDASFEMAKKSGHKYAMSESVKQFSFLNRWFVFRRKSMRMALEEEAVEPETALTAVAAPVSKNVAPATAAVTAALTPSAVTAAQVQKKKPRLVGMKTAAVATEPSVAAELTAAAAEPTNVKKVTVKMPEAEEKEADVPATRTLPVAPGKAAAPTRKYAQGEVFQFYGRASLLDPLGIKDPGAGRWLAPSAPFPLEDPDLKDAEGKPVTYPTLEHWMAAMMYKLASNKPEIAVKVFSRAGEIHQEYLRQRASEQGVDKKPLTEKRDFELLEQEAKDVKAATRPAAFKKYKATFDEVKWATVKDDALRQALEQRWKKDKRFRTIVSAVRDQGKVLLYFTPGASASNLGGIRRDDGSIEGENKIGKIIMELANFPEA